MVVRTKVRSPERVERLAPALERLGTGLRGDLLFGAAAALLSLLLGSLVLRAWRGDLGVPFTYLAETQYYLMLAKTMEDHGGYFENPSLGAPFGLDLHDFAVGTDRLNLDLLRLTTAVFGSPAAGVNVFFLLSFALAGAAAYLVFRLLRVGRAPALACSILFALVPYHFARGEGHLFLTAYYVVPLGVYLALATVAGEPLWERRHGRTGWRAYLSRPTLLTVAFCLLVGSTGIYYAVFTLVVLGAAIVLALVGRAGWRSAAGAAACAGLIVAVVLVNLAPTVAYRIEHGVNTEAQRSPIDTELLALKVADLVLPPAESKLGPLSRLTATYQDQTPIRSEGGQSLGLVGAAGLVGLLAIALLALVRRSRAGPPVVRDASALALICVLLGTVGGGSVLVAHTLTSQIRAWNRISIVIAFLAFLAVAVALDRLAGRRRLYVAALAGVLVVGIWTQGTGARVPPYELAATWEQDRQFFGEVERRLGRGATVFFLPYIAFPEAGQLVDLDGNDPLRGYLHTDHLRWSFGAMKGRPEDWPKDLSAQPNPLVVDGAVAAGFTGLVVDRYGYADRAAALESELTTLTGGPPFVNASGRHSFFDLRGRLGELRASHGEQRLALLREAVLRPLRLAPRGFLPLLRSGPFTIAWAHEAEAELRVVNSSETPRTARFLAVLDRVGGDQAQVSVSFVGGEAITVQTPTRLDQELVLEPGENVIRISTAAPAVEASNVNELRRHYFRLSELLLMDAGIRPFLRPHH